MCVFFDGDVQNVKKIKSVFCWTSSSVENMFLQQNETENLST